MEEQKARLGFRIDEIGEKIDDLEREKAVLVRELEEIEKEELRRGYERRDEVLAMLREEPMSAREIDLRLGITFPIKRLEEERLVEYDWVTGKWKLVGY